MSDPELRRWNEIEPLDPAERRAAELLRHLPPPLPLSPTALARIREQVEARVRSGGVFGRLPRAAILGAALVGPLAFAAANPVAVQRWARSLPEIVRALVHHRALAATGPASVPLQPSIPARSVTPATSSSSNVSVELPNVRSAEVSVPIAPQPLVGHASALREPRRLSEPESVEPTREPRRVSDSPSTAAQPRRRDAEVAELMPGLDLAAAPAPVTEKAPAKVEADSTPSAPKGMTSPTAPIAAPAGTLQSPDKPSVLPTEPSDSPDVLVRHGRSPVPAENGWACDKPLGEFGEARVLIRVRVTGSGDARDIEVLQAPSKAYVQAARDCAVRQRYEPGTDADGVPVDGMAGTFWIRFK